MSDRKLRVASRLGIAVLAAFLLGIAAPTLGGTAGVPPPSATARLSPEELLTIGVFERSSPAVVYITSIVRHADEVTLAPMEMPQGTGSGFVWDRRGNIVTNFHVIVDADAVEVTLPDHSTWRARLVGAAPEKDLAVLRIDAPPQRLQALPLGDSRQLLVGQRVLAIGNPFGLDHTLTTGVVSALGREIDSLAGLPIRDVIQTDAAINPGNSGGPLLDSSGRLIGVNAALYSPSGTWAGVGFAIPAHTVRWVVPQLIAHGVIRRPSLGLQLAPDTLARRLGIEGALVLLVEPGGPADRAGIAGTRRNPAGWALGDVIESLDDEAVSSASDLLLMLEERSPPEEVRLGLRRDGVRRSVLVPLEPGREHFERDDERP